MDRQINGMVNLYYSVFLNLIFIVILAITREEQKTIIMIKDAAKKNQMDVCKISAKSLVK